MKFADDTKLFRKVKEIGDKQNLQDDIDKLVKWSEKWQMLFNFGKCKCLHTGSGNTGMNYEMGGTILSKTVKEKDLGVTMNANMKVSEQCRIAASKGNQVLGMIRRNITYKEKSLIIPLYKAIVRPHLEYCIQAWNPHLRKDVDMLEKIQSHDMLASAGVYCSRKRGDFTRRPACEVSVCIWEASVIQKLRGNGICSYWTPRVRRASACQLVYGLPRLATRMCEVH